MSSTATATTTTTTAKLNDRSSSSASQKFWPLKKFGLHNKSDEQQSIALSQTNTAKSSSVAAIDEPAKDSSISASAAAANEKDAQKKSKNKRLSSLLSNRRQEGNVNTTPESTAVEITKKQSSNNNASNTPTLTRKTGREIGTKARAAAVMTTTTLQSNTAASAAKQNYNNMAAKSAGSGTLGRSSGKATRAKELKIGSVRRASEDRSAKRCQSPPATKANDVPIQPNIMLESVQKKIQQELESVITKDHVDIDSAIEDDNNAECNNKNLPEEKTTEDSVTNTLPINSITDESSDCLNTNDEKKDKQENELLNKCNTTDLQGVGIKTEPETSREEKEEEETLSSSSDDLTNKKVLPLPSPPVTPAAVATSLPEFSTVARTESPTTESAIEANRNATGGINIHCEPLSPTMCTFNVLQQSFVQPNNNNLNEIDKLHQQHQQQQQQLSSLFVQQQQQQQQQPIPRSIQQLRSASSFATLRQLASTNSSLQNQQHQQPYTIPQQQQQPRIQQIKRRPVSFIEPSSHSNINYSNYASSVASDDYLTVNRSIYNRRASSEDSSHFHIHQQSDNSSSISGNAIQHLNGNTIGSRRLVRSNTVHNLIIKDGQGHRIVQCVGLDQSPPLQPLRKNTSSFDNNNESYLHHHDWSPPPEILDDMLYASRQQQQQMEEQQYHQQQYLLIQQQQQHQLLQQDNNKADNASDTSGTSSGGGSIKGRITRKDSAKSISSLCSSSPPITSYDSRFEKLKNKLENERAIVKALQKQKEACNKDVTFLNKSVDDLTTENQELKKKYENEKTLKERFQDDLSSALDKLNEATEHIRQLENQNKALKVEIDDKNLEIRELEKKKQTTKGKFSSDKSSNHVLAAQLQHSQNQVRLLKSTMEQFLRMGVFNDELNASNSSFTSPTTSIEAILPDFKCNKSRQQQQQRRNNNPAKNNNKSSVTANGSATTIDDASSSNNNTATITSHTSTTTPPPATTRSRKSLVLTENLEIASSSNKATKTAPEKNSNKQQDELDIELLELQREKEILQAEYSKAPSSGGNALIRRRREELESRLDIVDSQMCRIKLKMRSRNIL